MSGLASMSGEGGSGGALSVYAPSSSSSALTLSTQHQQQRQSASDTRVHTMLQAAQLLEREMEQDERRDTGLDSMQSNDNGLYQFESGRLELRRSVPIPQAIIDQYDHLECKSFVGLFPEIHRAYITIDNKLFLWNYYDGSDFYLYDDLSQIIISVALVKPRVGVFVPSIQHLLVVSTPVELLIFAVRFEGGNVHGALQLLPTQFTLPSDNVHMTDIIGTDEGRILLCGKDGGMYEIEYSTEEGGWFGGGMSGGIASYLQPFSSLLGVGGRRKKCRKLNHTGGRFRLVRTLLPTFLGGISTTGPLTGAGAADPPVERMVYDNTRNLLFTLSSIASGRVLKPVICCYDLGKDGWGMTLRSRNDDLLTETRSALRSVPSHMWEDLAPSGSGSAATGQHELKIVSIAPIPRSESSNIVLLAVTSHGHRLFFELSQVSRTLRVKFVRLCPPALHADELNRGGGAASYYAGSAARAAQRLEPRYEKGTSPSLVHAAYYRDGVLLAADAGRSALGDTLIAVHRDAQSASSSTSSSTAVGAYRTWGTSYGAQMNECIEALDLESRIADVSEVHPSASLNLLSSALFARAPASSSSSTYFGSSTAPLRPLQGLHELATQHLTPNRHFLVLTSTSLLTLRKLRPLDELRHALSVKKRTGDDSALARVAHKYGAKEAAAMCLVIIGAHFVGSGNGAGERDHVERKHVAGAGVNGSVLSISSPNKLLAGAGATASPSQSQSSSFDTGNVSEEQLRKLAKAAFFRFTDLLQQEAQALQLNAYGARPATPATGQPRLDSITLYLSRWLRAHWDWSLCIPAPATTLTANGSSSPYLSFRFSQAFYIELLQPLQKLRRFLDDNQHLLLRDALAAGATTGRNQQADGAIGGVADPHRLELDTFDALSSFLSLTMEVFNLLVLFQGQGSAAASSMMLASNGAAASSSSLPRAQSSALLLHNSRFISSADLQALKDTKLCDILTSNEGHMLVKKLINTLADVGSRSARGGAGAPVAAVSLTDSGIGKRGKRVRYRDLPDLADDGEMDGDAAAAASELITQLHTACPTFFGHADLLYYNALESLQAAKLHWSLPSEREHHLNRALDTYRSLLRAPPQAFPLEDIATHLKGVYAYESVVELAMARAELLDRREVAVPRTGGMAGVGAAIGASASASTALVPVSQSTDAADFYTEQKRRCFEVILDSLNILVFGLLAGKSGQSGNVGVEGGMDGGSASGSTIPPPSPDSLARVRERVVSRILASPDAALHEALYSWLLEKQLLDELFAIHTPHLIRFLTRSEAHLPLLKDYYLRNSKWHEAALLLNYMAMRTGPQYSLSDRIDFLTRSLHCARNCQQQRQQIGAGASGRGSFGSNGYGARSNGMSKSGEFDMAAWVGESSVTALQDLIDQLKDRIEIARIQSEIYKKIQTLLQESYSDASLSSLEHRLKSGAGRESELQQFVETKESLQSALGDLDSALLDLEALYLLCTRFGLWECCLSIFAFSNESERSDVIAALWKNVFRAEMSRCKRRGMDWADSVREKFIELASDPATNYRTIDFLFPLQVIIRELEINNFKHRRQPSYEWVSATLLAAGLSPNRLLQQYEALMESWEEEAGRDRDPMHHQANVNAQGQTIQTYLYWSVWHILKAVIQQERPSGVSRRSSSSTSSAVASQMFNEVLTNLRSLPPSDDNDRLAHAFQQLYAQFNQTR